MSRQRYMTAGAACADVPHRIVLPARSLCPRNNSPWRLQAMDLIAIAQQTGDVSPEAYQRLALRGTLQPPEMAGIEDLMQRLAVAEAAANPFANGGSAAEASPSGGGGYAQFRPPAVIPPSMASPARSQARPS